MIVVCSGHIVVGIVVLLLELVVVALVILVILFIVLVSVVVTLVIVVIVAVVVVVVVVIAEVALSVGCSNRICVDNSLEESGYLYFLGRLGWLKLFHGRRSGSSNGCWDRGSFLHDRFDIVLILIIVPSRLLCGCLALSTSHSWLGHDACNI